MNAIELTIVSLDDIEKGKHPLENVKREDIQTAHHFSVGVLEANTTTGRTGLMFILKDKEGTSHVARMTASQFDMLVGIFRGAIHRFGK